MDTLNKLRELSNKIRLLKSSVHSEEATKISFVLPFFSILGYDVFNHLEVCPEYKSTFKTDGTTKVDLAILKNNTPEILIEIKDCNFTLTEQFVSQLASYYAPCKEAKFAALTNGIQYRFYTDVKSENLMDTEHFLEIDLLSLDERAVLELEMFVKGNFDAQTAKKRAEYLLYEKQAYLKVSKEFENPSEDFTRLVFGENSPELTLCLTSAISRYVKDVTSENSSNLEPASDTFETVDKSLSENENRLFSLVKGIIEGTGSEHRYKVRFQRFKKRSCITYRNADVCFFAINEGVVNFSSVRFLGTTIETRKTSEEFPLSSLTDILNFKPKIEKQIEFIDWWYKNPKAEKGGIE